MDFWLTSELDVYILNFYKSAGNIPRKLLLSNSEHFFKGGEYLVFPLHRMKDFGIHRHQGSVVTRILREL